MRILNTGLNLNGTPLFKSAEEETMAKALISSMERNFKSIQGLSRTTAETASFRGEIERTITDLGDPRAAGWMYLLNSSDPQRKTIETIMEPLARHRGMESKTPLLYHGEPPDEWFAWLHDHYFALELEGKKVPQYILIVGGPDKVPFHFQSILDTVASVGRVDFETVNDLKTYISKVIKIETAAKPCVSAETLFFAPDGGIQDPTYFSRKYMAEPIADHVNNTMGIKTSIIAGENATKANLAQSLSSMQPSLVYTASHGLIAYGQPPDIQMRLNGGICCKQTGGPLSEWLFSSDDISYDRPFLEGAVFFQFACFGYGTPAQSDYTHWIEGVPKQYTDADFVASLPKRMLAHPRGPIAFIGHMDTAFLHAFADVENPEILDRWHTRIAPFVNATNKLLQGQPCGLAMHDMNVRYSVCNSLITNTYDRQQRGTLQWNTKLQSRFLDNWITRSDAQNYMIFGDPAVRLRIPSV